MKSTIVIIISTATVFLCSQYITSTSSLTYNGEYDVSAKDMAYLCMLIKDYKKTGMKPVVADVTPPVPREKYMNDKTKCWKFQWNACNAGEVGKPKPCGWYQMMEDPDPSMCS